MEAVNNTRKFFRKVEIDETLHKQIRKKCWENDVKIKDLTSALISKMFKDHPEEIEKIIKEIKMKRES